MATIDALRDLIWVRDGGMCGICGQAVARTLMDLDHIQPRSRGGPDTVDNLRATHPTCNRQRGAGREVGELGLSMSARLPRDLHSDLRRAAHSDERSLNSMLVIALREWLQNRRKRPAQ